MIKEVIMDSSEWLKIVNKILFINCSQIPALIKNFFMNVIKRPDDNLIILRIVFSLVCNKPDAHEFMPTEKKNK